MSPGALRLVGSQARTLSGAFRASTRAFAVPARTTTTTTVWNLEQSRRAWALPGNGHHQSLGLRNTTNFHGRRGLTTASDAESTSALNLQRTPLYDFHLAHGAKMVPFANYAMPLQYDPQGLVTSHQHTRTACSLFDVSHMAQVRVTGRDRVAFLEQLVVGDIQALKPGQMTLSLLTNENGGIIDDTVITNQPHWFNDQAANCGSDVAVSPSEPALYMVLNAACADKDLAHLRNAVQASGLDVTVSAVTDCALLALQGPKAAAVLERLAGQSFAHLAFMHAEMATLGGAQCHIARCGYTGEDGFEISVPAGQATHLAEQLLADPAVELAGLAVRDSLRLEAGLCLYGHDLNETTTPVEAGLTWTIGKRRRQPGADTFPGAAVILPQIKIKGTSAGYNPPSRRRVGLVVEKSPAREHAIIYNQDQQPVGAVTSGMPSPTTRGLNIAMGYVQDGYHKTGTELLVGVRKRLNPAKVVKMPFVPAQYYKGA